MPKISPSRLEATQRLILNAARSAFSRYGYEGATVRRLEQETGLSRGAIFHHFKDKEALFLAVASDDTAAMVRVISEHGLIQVMRDLVAQACDPESTTTNTGWLGTQLEISRRVRTDAVFAQAWGVQSQAIINATIERLDRQRRAGVLRRDVDLATIQLLLQLVFEGLAQYLCLGQATSPASLNTVLDLLEEALRG